MVVDYFSPLRELEKQKAVEAYAGFIVKIDSKIYLCVYILEMFIEAQFFIECHPEKGWT